MSTEAPSDTGNRHGELHRIEHYALSILNSMAAAGSGALTDSDIDYAIDLAERLANKLLERGHIHHRG
ncbi:MAG: hypothetical protein H6Q00_652 [Holophagaceae bacterium]|nr:hypothetical protein [Holophagaceae bacterium]